MSDQLDLPVEGIMPFGWGASEAPSPAEAFAWAQKHGQCGVSLKVVNRSGYQRQREIKWIREALPMFRAAGMEIMAWGYIGPAAALARGRAFGDLCRREGYRLVGINAEIEFKQGRWTGEKGERAARDFGRGFLGGAGRDVYPILSTFAQPSLHGTFPYAAFLEWCCGFGPQLYGSSPVKQLMEAARTAEEYGVDLIPTYRAYAGDGISDWGKIEGDLRRTIRKAGELGVRHSNFWRWKSARERPSTMEILKGAGGGTGVEGPDAGRSVARFQDFLNSERLPGDALLKVDNDLGAKTLARARQHMARMGLGVARVDHLAGLVERASELSERITGSFGLD